MRHILITGCGDIGKRVARLWGEHGKNVYALIRDPHQTRHLRDMRINPVMGDLDNPDTLVNLPVQDALIYYFAPPAAAGDDDPRMHNFINCLTDHNHPAKIIYISTTGVYGDCHGAWVTEDSPVNPQTPRSIRRLAAERLLKEWHDATAIPVVILRVAGIYGPGRLPIERIKSGQPVLHEKEAPYSNRIHADDLAFICLSTGEHPSAGYRVYNISDGHPTTMTDYFMRVATKAGLPLPRIVSINEARRELDPLMLSFLDESKRVDNRRMLQELGVKLRYPDLATGLDHCQVD